MSSSNILKLLRLSKRPVILLGHGVRNDIELFNQVFNNLNIPILTTWRAADLMQEKDPRYCGRPGMIGQRGANFIIQNCDLLISLGARLDMAQVAFDYKKFAPHAIKFTVDVDRQELEKCACDILAFNTTCKNFLDDTQLDLKTTRIEPFTDWLISCKLLHRRYQYELLDEAKQHTTDGYMSLYEFLHEINPWLQNKTIVLGSSGSIAEVFFQVIEILPGMRIINTPGLGSMGFGIPAAIGAHYATGKEIVCFEGDGSFVMNAQELTVVSNHALPIQFYVINNSGYASIRNTQNNLCDGRLLGSDEASGLELPNLTALSEGYGLQHTKITCKEEVTNHLGYPSVMEVITDPSHVTVCRTKTRQMPDGKLQATSLDDLWPFLSEEEQKKVTEKLCNSSE